VKNSMRIAIVLLMGSILFLGGLWLGRDGSVISAVQARTITPIPTPTPFENVPTGFRASNNQNRKSLDSSGKGGTAKMLFTCGASCSYDLIAFASNRAAKALCQSGTWTNCVIVTNKNSFVGATYDSDATPHAEQSRDVTIVLVWTP